MREKESPVIRQKKFLVRWTKFNPILWTFTSFYKNIKCCTSSSLHIYRNTSQEDQVLASERQCGMNAKIIKDQIQND